MRGEFQEQLRRLAEMFVLPESLSRLRAALRRAAITWGPGWVRMRLRSSPKVTSRMSKTPFSIVQWLRLMSSNRAALAWSRDRLVMPYTTSREVRRSPVTRSVEVHSRVTRKTCRTLDQPRCWRR